MDDHVRDALDTAIRIGETVQRKYDALVRDVEAECSRTTAPSRQRLREAIARSQAIRATEGGEDGR